MKHSRIERVKDRLSADLLAALADMSAVLPCSLRRTQADLRLVVRPFDLVRGLSTRTPIAAP